MKFYISFRRDGTLAAFQLAVYASIIMGLARDTLNPRCGFVMIACSGRPWLLTQLWNCIDVNPTCG